MEKGNKLPSKKVFRIIDANLNRCREGLRVIEETARFILNDKKRYRQIRNLRHKLDKATRSIYCDLLKERKSEKDVGSKIEEGTRKNLNSVVRANFKRVEESLRVLEEYSKLISAGAGRIFKSIRFKIYIIEKDINVVADLSAFF